MFKKFVFICFITQCFYSLTMEDMAGDFNNLQINNIKINNINGDVHQTDYPLHSAIKKGQLNKVKEILNKKSMGIDEPDDQGKTPLYLACLFREYEIIKLLINHGADKAKLENTSFLSKPEYQIVVELLSFQTITDESLFNILNELLKKNLENKKVFSAYQLMVKYDEIGNDKEINWYVKDEFGKDLLFYSVENNNIPLIKKFINLGFDVNKVDKDEKPLIIHAVETGNVELLDLLMKSGANIDITYKKLNPLYFVTNKLSNPNMIEFLVNHGCHADFEVLFECLFEIPATILTAILKKKCGKLFEEDFTRNRNNLKNFLMGMPLTFSKIIDRIIVNYIKENNTQAVKSLLLLFDLNKGSFLYELMPIDFLNKFFDILMIMIILRC